MNVERFEIDEDIARARTLPAAVYRDPRLLDLARERVFAPSWQLVPEADRLSAETNVVPFTLLPASSTSRSSWRAERARQLPLERLRPSGQPRGARSGKSERLPLRLSRPVLRARRSLRLDARVRGGEGLPRPSNDLRRVEHGALGPLRFVSLAPALSLDALLRPLRERVGWLPFERCVLDPTRSRDYTVRASWALYVDNYLEGFHVPFVHRALARTLDYASYTTEVFDWSNLQVGVAAEGEEAFDPPAGSLDHGRRIAGYYFWLFPNTMLNLYPWGILGEPRPAEGAGPHGGALPRLRLGSLEAREGGGRVARPGRLEDEAVVEAVQKGVRSRLYERGRYSAKREASSTTSTGCSRALSSTEGTTAPSPSCHPSRERRTCSTGFDRAGRDRHDGMCRDDFEGERDGDARDAARRARARRDHGRALTIRPDRPSGDDGWREPARRPVAESESPPIRGGGGGGGDMDRRLDAHKITVNFEGTALGDAIDFVRDVTGINIAISGSAQEKLDQEKRRSRSGSGT